MIPYIVGLVFLIVIILYQVYSSSESFTTRDASGNPIVTRDASGNPIVTRDASGNVTETTVMTDEEVVTHDASGNEIRLSLSDLFGLLGPFKTKDKEKESQPAPTVPETPMPSITTPTSASTKELEDRIAKAIAKQVKDELVSQRSTDEVYDKYAPCDLTNAEAQGQEFENQYPRPSRQPDMSEYIRKDSIPCWNCSIP